MHSLLVITHFRIGKIVLSQLIMSTHRRLTSTQMSSFDIIQASSRYLVLSYNFNVLNCSCIRIC